MDTEIRWRLDGQRDPAQPALFEVEGPPPRRELPAVEYLHVRARSVLNRVPPASQMPFRYTVNAYRGCTHACVYCFARPTHAHLGLGTGEDFERRIVVKVNAVERLREELAHPSWTREHVALGTNTDPYQQCEGRYRLTQGVVRALMDAATPCSVLTKSSMVLRDVDLLAEGAERGLVRAAFSIGTLRRDVWQLTEPGTPPPARRVEALARLVDAGIPTGVLIAPVIPGLSDDAEGLEEVVRAVLEAGASSVVAILLHLRPGVREHVEPWLADVRPDLVERYDELYARRHGYAPRAEQDRLARVVGSLVERHGGLHRHPRHVRPPETAPAQVQLALG